MTLLRGVTRSKRMSMRWMRTAADKGHVRSCSQLASRMYGDRPYARAVGHVEEAAGVAASAGSMEGHDVPPDVLTSVVHWLRKGGHDPIDELDELRRDALDGAQYCHNDGCEVVGHLKDFKVCPQCKTARYCGDACQKAGLDNGWAQGDVWHTPLALRLIKVSTPAQAQDVYRGDALLQSRVSSRLER